MTSTTYSNTITHVNKLSHRKYTKFMHVKIQPRSQGFGGFGGAGDKKALVQGGHVTRNMPNIWEYFITRFYLNYARRKILRIKILEVEAANGKHGDK